MVTEAMLLLTKVCQGGRGDQLGQGGQVGRGSQVEQVRMCFGGCSGFARVGSGCCG